MYKVQNVNGIELSGWCSGSVKDWNASGHAYSFISFLLIAYVFIFLFSLFFYS